MTSKKSKCFFCFLEARVLLQSKIFKKNSDVLFTAKAYNGRIILEWLTHEVYAASTSEGAAEFDSRFHLIAAALMLFIAKQFFLTHQKINFEIIINAQQSPISMPFIDIDRSPIDTHVKYHIIQDNIY